MTSVEEVEAEAEAEVDGAGAEAEAKEVACAACRRRLGAADSSDLRPLAELFERATGEALPAGDARCCSSCRGCLLRLHRVDLRWRELRRELLSTIGRRPPDEGDALEFCDVAIKTEFDDDSDDEPLYKFRPEDGERRPDDDSGIADADQKCATAEARPFAETEQSEKKNLKRKRKREFDVNYETDEDDERSSRKSKGKTKKGRVNPETNPSKFASALQKKLATANATIKKVPYSSDGEESVKKTHSSKKDKTLSSGPSNSSPALAALLEADSDSTVARRVGKKKEKKREVLQCSKCPATFMSQVRLDLHMVKHAGANAPYICEICGAGYKHKKACDIHVGMHNGISPWKCVECGKIFPSKGALSRHEAIHTGTPNYQCDLCGKSFIHTSSFKMHKLSHSGVKPHTCTKCGLSLMTRSHLKRHQRVHSGEKRHECLICGKKFSERYNLYAHQKSHEISDAPRKLKSHDCTVCEATFNRRNLLDKHMEIVHNCVSESGPKKSRNTMNKLLKRQTVEISPSIKMEPRVTPVEVVEVKLSNSPPPPPPPQTNGETISSTLTSEVSFVDPEAISNSNVENNSITLHSNHNAPWHGLNYHLANDYPLRMHGVDYAGYLNRQ